MPQGEPDLGRNLRGWCTMPGWTLAWRTGTAHGTIEMSEEGPRA